jgi:BirA family biotin operon repressor/biotin-[acetyl-CoA-carboxylase] ligase
MTPLSRELVEALGSPLAARVEHHEELASTQARACELAREAPGAPHGALVLADSQTGGRGRRGRSWESPRGGLWMSLVLRPELPAALAPRVTQAAAVAVAQTLRAYGVDARVKWPNDVLVGCRRKICGILAGSSLRDGGLEFVILGIGLNANLDPGVLAERAGTEATSLRAELGRDADLLRLLDALLGELHRTLGSLHHGFDAVLSERRLLECTLGERVRVRKDGEALEGRVLDLSPEGALVLETGAGRVELFEGEVERLLRRPR